MKFIRKFFKNMLDIRYIRANANKIQESAKNKNIDIDINRLLEIDKKRGLLLHELEKINSKRNKIASQSKGGKPTKKAIVQGKKLKEKALQLEKELNPLEDEYQTLMVKVPVIPSEDTPVGKDENGNVVIFTWGDIPKFDFQPKDHIELGQDLDLLDFKRGAKVAGYRGYYVKNEAVMMQMGIMMLGLEKMLQKGFTLMIPPTLVREFVLFGSGYFAGKEYNAQIDEIYKIANDEKLADGSTKKESKFLIGTAEPSLLAYYADEVLDESQLPLKLCGFSQCYRSEIGSYGKDTKGMYRVHEFMKVEQVVLAPADIALSNKLQEEMIGISKELHEDLGLPYRQVQICTGDMSVGKYRMFDLEAWIPTRKDYGETGSASNFLDWQARRLNVRYKDKAGKKKFVYMLNNTVLPSPRIIIAIMENYQQNDGSIVVPEVLQKYVGKKVIKKK